VRSLSRGFLREKTGKDGHWRKWADLIKFTFWWGEELWWK